MSDKNIYAKLQEARCLLQKLPITKSGYNGFAKYKYFELGDFLPSINDINQTVGIMAQISFESETHVKLHIINIDKPDEIISFYSKNVEAGVKGAQPIQNLGAQQTYQRRYLYNMAYEIVEGDAIDAVKPDPKNAPKPTPKKEQKPAIYKLDDDKLKSLGIHLASLETSEEINNTYKDITKRANGMKLDPVINEIFQDATEKLNELEIANSQEGAQQ